MVEIHRYDAHGRLLAIFSPPSETTIALVLIVGDAFAVSAAILRARGNAFRHEIVTSIFHKVVVTDTMIRRDAVAVFTTVFADGLADALVSQFEAAVACTTIRLCTCAVSAALCAKGHAMIVLILCVTVLADANIGCDAYSIRPARKVANWFTNTHRAVVQRGRLLTRPDPR